MRPFEEQHDSIRSMSEGQLRDFARELERKTNYLSVIYQFALTILDINNLDELMWYVAREVVARMDFRDCVIYQIDKARGVLMQKAACGVKNPEAHTITNQLEIPINEGIVGSVARNGKPVLLGDVRKDPRYIFDVEPALSELAVPIIYKDEVLGVIDCEDMEQDYFTAEHLEILTTVAAILSTKITQTMTIERLEESISELEYAERLQSALFKIATLSYSAENLKEFYHVLHEILDTLLYAKNLIIGLYEQESDRLNFPYASDEKLKEQFHKGFSDNQAKTLHRYVLESGQSQLFNQQDIVRLMGQQKISTLDDVPVSWLGVPFQIRESAHGIVAVQSYNKNITFTDKDKELLRLVSSHISSAINRRLSEQKLQHQALHDALTGLPNRLLLIDRISHALARLIRDKTMQHALLFLDLDRFKTINDSLGHLVGDRFLQAVCAIIQECLRAEDTLARLGGDEFAILIEDIDDREAVCEIAQRINQRLSAPILIEEYKVLSSASIGIAYADVPDLDPFLLLQQADAAMYRAKSQGAGRYCEYDKSMHQTLQNLAQLEYDIKNGLIDNEFTLYYQPIFDISNNKLIAFEALARWNHPKRGLILPEQFIDHAESTSHIVELDNAMLILAAKQLQAWPKRYAKCLRINVNVSSKNFSNPGFVDFLTQVYTDYYLPKGALCIEITERALIENLEDAKRAIESIRDLGAEVILDDFGTGYSSLSYLHKFPMDALKIDKSFVHNIEQKMPNNVDSYPVIGAIVALAKSLNLKVVAEGIEQAEQLETLKKIGCDYGQGFLLSEPLTADEALSFMRNHRSARKS